MSDNKSKIIINYSVINILNVRQGVKMDRELRKTTVKLHQRLYDVIENIAKKEGVTVSEVMRDLLDKALTERVTEENMDVIARVVRQQVEVVMKPHVERICALSSKGGHMAAAAAFLNTQALMDLVPPERKKDARQMYENARKKAVAYMKTKTDEFEDEY